MDNVFLEGYLHKDDGIQRDIGTSRKEVLEHQATIANLGAHMGLGHQLGSQGPCGH
jgi:hypothetical protein